ncbi:MAG: hypothetical protein OEW97_07145 [Gammaproteobacteria bacterium]|nr:hypothetical protein [Gammaproteobacteria bacterium]
MKIGRRFCYRNIFYISCVFFSLTGMAEESKFNLNSNTISYMKFLPDDVIKIDSFKLCYLNPSDKFSLYACQNYTSGQDNFRLYFQGGRIPKFITQVSAQGDVKKILWSEENNTDKNQSTLPVYDLPPPEQIPDTAKFMGAGICLNSHEQDIPCAVFRNKAARLKHIYDYIVFFNKDGAGAEETTPIYIGNNHEAVTAEMAYQFGLSLANAGCCQQEALRYIEYAYQLFPGSKLYRYAYNNFRKLSGLNETVPLASFTVENLLVKGEYYD